MNIKIEKGISVPVSRRGGLYPWEQMKVGDSFLVSTEDDDRVRVMRSLVCSAGQWSKRRKGGSWKFTTRGVEGGVRVWRIK